jgi:hypothetical protein
MEDLKETLLLTILQDVTLWSGRQEQTLGASFVHNKISSTAKMETESSYERLLFSRQWLV